VALGGIAPWNDQNILLYHGMSDLWTASILRAVDLKQAQPLTDFGRGFYTTTKLEQARRWAQFVARTLGGSAAVIEFDVERNVLAQLECLFFIRSDKLAADFWSFVQYCKTIQGDHRRTYTAGYYDIVAGPVPGDWNKQSVIPDSDQVSFHTDAAVDVLNQLPAIRKTQLP
jgi:Protein of unknown function (DUF3990)